MPLDLDEHTPHVEDPNADEVSYNIDTATWGEEDSWFNWNQEPWTYPYAASNYSSFYQAFKAADMKSPYYYKSNSPASDQVNESYRVEWRGVWIYDFYHAQNDPEPIFKSNIAIKTKQWPTPWGFGLKSPMSNTFSVFPAYDVGPYVERTEFPEAMITYFWTSLTENFGPQPAIFKPGEDWGTETDSSKPHKPMPFIPCFDGTVYDNISYKQRNQNCYTYSDTSVGSPNYIPLSFNYQKIIVVPCVYCAKEDDTYDYGIRFGGKKTLQQYFDGVNWDPETQTGTPPANLEYPLITAVVLDRIYFGDTTETAQGRRYIDGTSLNSLLPDKLTTGSIPSTLIKINGTYTLKGSKWGEVGNENNWLPAKGYSVAIGTISGMGDTKNGARIQGMTINTSINDLRKAYIMATQSDTATVNLLHQNGDYEIYMKQKRKSTGSTYGYQFGMTSIWRNPTKEKVLRDVAYLGFWFADDYDTAANAFTGEDCNSSKMHIPLFDEDGLTTGKWLSGTDAAEADNAKWQDPFKSNPYNPDKTPPPPGPGPRPDPDPNPILPSSPAFTLAGRGTQCYAITPADMTEIYNDIYGRSSGAFEDLVDGLKLFGSDPMGAIISYKWYPFSFESPQSASIVLGTTELSPAHVYPIIQNVNNSLTIFKATFWYGRDKNFIES